MLNIWGQEVVVVVVGGYKQGAMFQHEAVLSKVLITEQPSRMLKE